MKNSSYENFHVDLTHPRALLRSTKENTNNNNKAQPQIIYPCPILIFHNLKSTDSKITFSNEPSLKKIKELKEVYGFNYILSCLEDTNYIKDLNRITDESNIERMEVNLHFSKLNDLTIKFNKEKFLEHILGIYLRLKSENITLLIHKASGEMKTTIIIYSLLRLSGEKKEDSVEIIRYLKNGNKKSIGDFNIEFIENNIIGLLLKRFNDYFKKY
jgi:hypothetical protein